jgi:hypothetical protein
MCSLPGVKMTPMGEVDLEGKDGIVPYERTLTPWFNPRGEYFLLYSIIVDYRIPSWENRGTSPS